MRILIVSVILFISINFFSFIERVTTAELLVLQLYKNNFEEYVFIDDDFNLKYDLDELCGYFKSNGYDFEKVEGELSFILSFRGAFDWEKQYVFCLEKNNEK